jgi:uncharacterized protein (DUF2236 family)
MAGIRGKRGTPHRARGVPRKPQANAGLAATGLHWGFSGVAKLARGARVVYSRYMTAHEQNRQGLPREEEEARQRDAEVFHRNLEEVKRRAAGPVEGLYGPGSLTWEILREVAVLAGGGRALLLQIAHPAVAAGVDQHSNFRKEPLGRARRTFSTMYQIAFGDLESALTSARRIHALHGRVRGAISDRDIESSQRRYRANDPALLFWVMTTLIDSALQIFEAVIRPLSREERQRGYEESKTIGLVMGIPLEAMPGTREDFEAYLEELLTGPTLEIGETARELCRLLFRSPFGLDRALTTGLLPAPLRQRFSLRYEAADQRRHEWLMESMKKLFRGLPPALRYVPAYHQATARLSTARGERAPASTRLIERLGRRVALPLGLQP